jgi:hypothetical protein
MSDLTSAGRFRYVAKAVLRSPLSVGIIVAGAAMSLAAGNAWWAPMVLGAGAWFWLLFSRLHNEEYLRKLFAELQARENDLSEEQVETALEGMDFETRQRIRYIVQLQKEIMREARADDVADYARRDLDRLASQLAPVVKRSVRIATRKQQLVKYLHNVDERALANYATNLRQRIEATQDPVARSQYEHALKAREAELQTYQAISQAAGRIDSQLESVEATFASWKAKVIRIKTVDVSGASMVTQGLDQELAGLNSDIDLLEGSVTEALSAEDQAMTAGQGQ